MTYIKDSDGKTWARTRSPSLCNYETSDGREVWVDGDGVNIQNAAGTLAYAPIEVVEASIAAHRAATMQKPAPAAVSISALPALPDATACLAYSYADDDGSNTTVSTGLDSSGFECLVVDNTGAEHVRYLHLDVVRAVLAALGAK